MTSSSAPTRFSLLTATITANEVGYAPPCESSRPGVGDRLHRGAFATLGLIPDDLRWRVLSWVFDRRFRSAPDPWGCGHRDYEAAKRALLIEAVPPDARRVLEFGCGAGHNIADLAARLPGARVLGVDISRTAAALAHARVAGHPNAFVDVTTPGWQDRAVQSLGGAVDCLVLAEVLYYLAGRTRSLQVSQLAPLLSPGASVVLVHSGHDGQALHARALGDLGTRADRSDTFATEEGTFVIGTGTRWRPRDS